MNDTTGDGSDRANQQGQEGAACDGPSCESGCGRDGLPVGNRHVRTVILLAVGLAALALVARGILKSPGSTADGSLQSFTRSPVPADVAGAEPGGATADPVSDDVALGVWGVPLDSFAALDSVAADKDAVFVLLSAGDDSGAKDAATQVEAAARKIMSRGPRIGLHTLKTDSADYARLAKQTAAPRVLAMSKGCGSTMVSGEITEAKLMEAFITASRPSACGASSGCGTADCD